MTSLLVDIIMKANVKSMGFLPDTQYCGLRMPGTLPPPPRVSDPDMHHGACVTHVPWCMLGSLTSGFLRSRWRGKRSRHSRCMHNPHIWVPGKWPMMPAHPSVSMLIYNLFRIFQLLFVWWRFDIPFQWPASFIFKMFEGSFHVIVNVNSVEYIKTTCSIYSWVLWSYATEAEKIKCMGSKG